MSEKKGNDRKWQEMTGNDKKCWEMTGIDREWQEIDLAVKNRDWKFLSYLVELDLAIDDF